MPRKKVILKKEIVLDPKFSDPLIGKMVGVCMKKGKRSVSETLCYRAFDHIEKKVGTNPLEVFKSAVENVKPMVEVKSRRVGGASYQVPVEVLPGRRISLALRWILSSAKKRPGKSMEEKLAAELLDASNRTGGAVKKQGDTHRMAEANKAFAHYRW